jgi:predicted O-methyltransferase YrrM
MFAAEDVVTTDARRRGQRALPPEPAEAALLGWLVGRLGPTGTPDDVVEVGAAGGVGALHLIPALPPTATLTTIEPDTEAHALAAEALEVAGHNDRVRAILGDPAEVLPRLSDGRYGMCILQGDPRRALALLPDVLRVLAAGGLLVVRGVLRRGEHGTVLARLLGTVADDQGLDATVLHEHDGVLLVTRR